jgi:preprotein translocase subunit SecE
VARRKRRDDDAVEKRLDQETDGALDAAAEDLNEDALDADPDDVDAESDGKSGRVGTAVKRAKADPDSDTKTKSGKTDKPETSRQGGPISRLTRFVREVIAELRKVIWPTRKELLTYTVVVVFFVAVMLAVIGVLDFGFAKAMLWVFGSNTAEE